MRWLGNYVCTKWGTDKNSPNNITDSSSVEDLHLKHGLTKIKTSYDALRNMLRNTICYCFSVQFALTISVAMEIIKTN